MAYDYQNKGVSFVAISSNDIENYPEDSPQLMRQVAIILLCIFMIQHKKRQRLSKSLVHLIFMFSTTNYH